MEGPHGSGGATPEQTVAWMWGYLYGFCSAWLMVGVLILAMVSKGVLQ